MTFDLNRVHEEAKQDDAGVEMAVQTRNGDPALDSEGNPVTFHVLGEYSQRVRKVVSAQTQRLIRRRAAASDAADLLRNRIEVGCAAVTGWKGVESDGKPVAFDHALLATLFERAPWVLEQVERTMQGYSGFFGSASTS